MEITKKLLLKDTIKGSVILTLFSIFEIGLGGAVLIGGFDDFPQVESKIGFIFMLAFGGLFFVGGLITVFLAIKSLVHVIWAMNKTWYYNYFDCLNVEIIESQDSEESDMVILTVSDGTTKYSFESNGLFSDDVVPGDTIIVVSSSRTGDISKENWGITMKYVKRYKDYFISEGPDFCREKKLVPKAFYGEQ